MNPVSLDRKTALCCKQFSNFEQPLQKQKQPAQKTPPLKYLEAERTFPVNVNPVLYTEELNTLFSKRNQAEVTVYG